MCGCCEKLFQEDNENWKPDRNIEKQSVFAESRMSKQRTLIYFFKTNYQLQLSLQATASVYPSVGRATLDASVVFFMYTTSEQIELETSNT